jgi:preprotein translocase subunit SecA
MLNTAMLGSIFKKVFGTSNERVISSLKPIVATINSFEATISKLSDEALASKTIEFKDRLAQGQTLEDILPEAFAVVREASIRTIGLRHFDVQLIGGIILHRGIVSEMKTGEGKTVVATLPVYLNALTGKGVHVVTVNDYLVKRDTEWVGKIYTFLGLKVGCIYSNIDDETRKEAYLADITYGTNNEFGFDYLRDNLKYEIEHMAQREFNYAIVDEVDSILIDEARTPLIISGPTEDNSELYHKIDRLIPKLNAEDFQIDEKSKSVVVTDQGNHTIESLLKGSRIIGDDSSLYDFENMTVVHHVNQALKAHKVFNKDVDYIVKDGKVMIIDEFTGRIMEGRRYSEGLHQALEAKEKVAIQNENQTLASITFQNYFRMYPKLAGMTGTAITEADELFDIYKLEVVAIPTNLPITRLDEDDEIYLSAKEKYDAIVQEITKANEKGQPILVGTTSIEKSEYISSLLKKHKIKHNVLNARYHEQEAEIISQAGRTFAVTIATNMAGRGTDIKLGGNAEMLAASKLREFKEPTAQQIEKITTECNAVIEEDKQKVIELGGLFVLGTERHESRRIDNQLRGRSGRQGDPGRTKFYLSMEDDLMRIFGSEKITGMLSKLGLKDGEAIQHPWISRSLEKAQQKVEARNYDIRKNLLRFDDVMNDQRHAIYEQRKFLLSSTDLKPAIFDIVKDACREIITRYIHQNSLPEEWDLEGLEKETQSVFSLQLDLKSSVAKQEIANEEIIQLLEKQALQLLEDKYQKYGEETLNLATRQIMLLTLDHLWKDHLYRLDHLRTGIGLRAYAQKDPLNEYKMEAFNLFKLLLDEVERLAISRICHLEISHQINKLTDQPKKAFETRQDPANIKMENLNHNPEYIPDITGRPIRTNVSNEDRNPQDPSTWGKVARNEDCPCGSGKKYKHCHGAI